MEDLCYFEGGNYGQQLDAAYKSFREFCRLRKIKHSQPPFLPRMEPLLVLDPLFVMLQVLGFPLAFPTDLEQRQNITKHNFEMVYKTERSLLLEAQVRRPKTGEVGFVAKAWNGRCILSWLNHCLLDALAVHDQNETLVLTSAAMILVT